MNAKQRVWASRFIRVLEGDDYDTVVLAFEKFIQSTTRSSGKNVLDLLNRAYSSAAQRGTLNATIGKAGLEIE